MPTDNNTNSTTDSTDETSGQETQDQQQATTDETSGTEEQQPVKIDDSTKLPDTHPLVKAYRTQLEENRKLSGVKTELTEARAQAARTTQLEEELGKRPTTEALETLQTRYDRLEAFAQAVGLGKALDSRTFTKDLFETDKDIADLVKEYHKANPSATSTALGAKNSEPAESKKDPNALIRAAYNGGN